MQASSTHGRRIAVVGLISVALGLLSGERLLNAIFLPGKPGALAHSRHAILALQLILIGAGALFFLFRARPWTKQASDLWVGTLIAIGCTLVIDVALGRLEFPSTSVPQVVHPPNYESTVHNVEYSFKFQTNSMGLRNPDIPLARRADVPRVVIAGDSFTEGYGVEEEQSFVRGIEKEYAAEEYQVEFVNCGFAGTGPATYLRALLQVCIQYRPDVVLVALFPNDVADTDPATTPAELDLVAPLKPGMTGLLQALWPHLYAVGEAAQTSLAMRQADGEHASRTVALIAREARRRGMPETDIAAWEQRLPPDLVAAADRGEFSGFILAAGLLQPDYWTTSLDIEGRQAEDKYRAMIALLDEARVRSEALGVDVGIVLLPTSFQIDDSTRRFWDEIGVATRPEWSAEPTEFETRLARWAEQEGVPLLNLAPAFRDAVAVGTPEPLYYRLDGHWTPAGHALAAREIAAWLRGWSGLP